MDEAVMEVNQTKLSKIIQDVQCASEAHLKVEVVQSSSKALVKNGGDSTSEECERKFKQMELKYAQAKEQLSFYKKEVKAQVMLKRSTKKELREAVKQVELEKLEKVRVLKGLDSFLEDHETKIKVFINDKNDLVGDWTRTTNKKDAVLRQQVNALKTKEDLLNDANKQIENYRQEVQEKDVSLVSLEKEVCSQWDEITALRQKVKLLTSQNNSLKADVECLEEERSQRRKTKWYHRFMLWRRCGSSPSPQ